MDRAIRRSPTGPRLVAKPRQLARRRRIQTTNTRCYRDIRRLNFWLGCLVRGSDPRGKVVRTTSLATHQLAGDGSGSINHCEREEQLEKQVHQIPHRQQNDSGVYHEAGRHEIERDDEPHEETPRPDAERQHHPPGTSPRGREKCCRRLTFESGTGHQERVEARSTLVRLDSTDQPSGSSDNRLVRQRSQSPTATIRIPSPRRGSSAHRCPVTPVAESRSHLCISTDEPARQSPRTSLRGTSPSPATCSTGQPGRAVVSNTQEDPLAEDAANVREAHAAALGPRAPEPLLGPFGAVGDSRKQLLKGGYNRDVINRLHEARRGSTNQVYASKFKTFVYYCRERDLDPHNVTPGMLANFLHYLDVVKKLQPSTIKAYRAAIGHMTRAETGYDPGTDEICSTLVKSIDRRHPPTQSRTPKWDISVVLRALLHSENSDEQLTRHILTAKTAFLLALATGERRSGLHALSHEASLVLECPPRLVLSYVEGFVPKAWFLKSKTATLKPVSLPCVDDAAVEALCPVHTTIRYLQLVKEDRSLAQTSLLIPHNLANKNNLSVQAVARYIVKLVKWAYAFWGDSVPDEVRAHDTRGLAASLAALTSVALDDILTAGNWSNANTFLRHYFKTLSPDCVQSLAIIPSFVAGRSLISVSSVTEAVNKRRSKSETTAEAEERTPRRSPRTTKSLEPRESPKVVASPRKARLAEKQKRDHDYAAASQRRAVVRRTAEWVRRQAKPTSRARADELAVQVHTPPKEENSPQSAS